ncbi:hypothetical protein, conserved [Trypanosoma brucei gambiense DAL972]|uniref:Uncharacterized protein n=1 Tax=Trypanosoma brucei gambiense (strain MHOM/CI/86/DAL972) TaxID=679716 RepID=C9ZMY2_TRYB9|nr:hypothetical protein, conserved [Trypanosoma brucei gambiense DAL972]CBH10636.1 hypothetical protein, conserved [Trypanosoma brucei gambiense DAL972]|eukprot:XP_011772924.1 hypothetical protein, conserved [Trypanosoma brucei gambiense DAL972]
MKVSAVGTLPEDLIDAIRGGAVELHWEGDSVIVFHDDINCCSWRCELDAKPDGKELQPVSFRHQRTGEGGSACVPRIGRITRSEVHRVKDLADTTVEENAHAPVQLDGSLNPPIMNVTEVLTKYRPLVVRIVHYLAPLPRESGELMRFFSSEDGKVLKAVLNAFTTMNGRGQYELTAAGYELVDVESYDSKAVKQQVADRALQKIAHNKVLVDRFSLYADRDVLLAACSKGIMAGLGSSRSKRGRDDVDDNSGSDDDEDKGNGAGPSASGFKSSAQNAVSTAAKGDVVMFTSMSQSYIRWNDADLTKEPWEMPSAAAEALKQLQDAAKNARASAGKSLPPMSIMSPEQLSTAQERYGILRSEYTKIHDRLKRLEEVSEEVRGWSQTQGDRFTRELNEELRNWFERQEDPRLKLVAAMDAVHEALYRLKRDIEDYVNLRQWGVMM